MDFDTAILKQDSKTGHYWVRRVSADGVAVRIEEEKISYSTIERAYRAADEPGWAVTPDGPVVNAALQSAFVNGLL